MSQRRKGKLEARLNFPNLKLSIDSEEPVAGLRELNKIMHSLRTMDWSLDVLEPEDDPLYWKLGYVSEELRQYPAVMDFIRTAMKVEEHARHKRLALETKQVIDLEQNKALFKIDLATVKPKVLAACKGFELASYVVVHVIGIIPDGEKRALADLIVNKFSKADVRTVFTHKDLLGKTVVETLFFGQFSQDDGF